MSAAEPKRGRGRPRPQETINRDERVLQLLIKGPLTKTQVAMKLGIKPSEAYLALNRLRNAGLAQRGYSERNDSSSNVWEYIFR